MKAEARVTEEGDYTRDGRTSRDEAEAEMALGI